jgi:hypothetical protein
MSEEHSTLQVAHERYLQHVWKRQRFDASDLRTTDGVAVRIEDPGRFNAESGPDFLDAKIRIGRMLFSGDVEIHRNASHWIQHRHHLDERYNKVILHVILEGDHERYPTMSASGRSIPILLLAPYFIEPIGEVWKRAMLDEKIERPGRLKCYGRTSTVSSGILRPWLQQLAAERLEIKLRRFDERLRELATERSSGPKEPKKSYGRIFREGHPDDIPPPFRELSTRDLSPRELWDQLLYEGIMEGLGYSKNRSQFIRLSRNVSLRRIRSLKADRDDAGLEALLFGSAGLLPVLKSLQEVEARNYARQLRLRWKGFRKQVRHECVRASEWKFSPTRPANFPTLRIAAGARLGMRILHDDLFRNMIQSLKSSEPISATRSTLHRLLEISVSEFWSRHYSFNRASRFSTTPLGSARADDIIANAVIPLSLLYARVFSDQSVRRGAFELYQSYPALTDNNVIRLIDVQLLKGRVKLDAMSLQQGAIQLYKYYCVEERCGECAVGKIVFGDPAGRLDSQLPSASDG